MSNSRLRIVIPILTIIVSSMVLSGWIVGMDLILRIIPGAPTMKFNTALLFVLISLSILLLGNRNRILNVLAIGLAFLTFFISGVTLLQYLFEFNSGLDNFFVRDTITPVNPGRMSRATAFCFLMLSLAKLVRGISRDRRIKLVDYAVSLVAIISLLGLSTYLLLAIADNYVLVFNSMAVHTALLFLLASYAISLKHPDHSYVGFLTGSYQGSKHARKLLPFVVLLPLILSAALLYAVKVDLFETAYGIALYMVTYAVVSILYFSVIFSKLNRSDEERNKLEENLKASNQELSQYKAALDISSIVSITDLKGKITYVNQKFADTSGYSKKEVVGKTHRVVNSGHHPPSFFEDLWKTIESGSVWIGGIKNKNKAGNFYWVHTVIVPMPNAAGRIEHFLSIQQDITRITLLSHQYENLKLQNKELEQFTHIASHDLQEPLRTLVSMSTMLDKGYKDKLEGDGLKILEFIGSSARRMSNLVKGLMDYSRIGVNKELETVDTKSIVDHVLDDLAEIIQATGAEVSHSDLPEITAYPVQLRLLFQNLIQNAIKFHTPGKTPEISVSAIKESHHYRFTVADNGIGISSDQVRRIFGLFQTLHNRGKYEGTGIGLAHCEKIVHLHGGTIWAESEVGVGSSFHFTIPIT